MPVYVYKCKNDECPMTTFEVIQSMNEKHIAKCSLCGQLCEQDISAKFSQELGIGFKGPGFYVTDNPHP